MGAMVELAENYNDRAEYEQAERWFRIAATQGDAYAARALEGGIYGLDFVSLRERIAVLAADVLDFAGFELSNIQHRALIRSITRTGFGHMAAQLRREDQIVRDMQADWQKAHGWGT